jgi:hypothetical protein
MFVKLQVEHNGRLHIHRWEIDIVGGALTGDHNDAVATPCAFLLGPP